MSLQPFVRGATLSNYAEVAAQVGLDAGPLLRRAGIDRRALLDPDLRLPARQVVDLLEASAIDAHCPTFGLRMAESRQLSHLGAISLLIAHQATMREALLTVVEQRQLVNPSLAISLEEHDDLVVVREELLIAGAANARQSYDLAVGVLYRLFRSLLGSRWRALSVNFTYAPPEDLTVHRRIFGPICEFRSDFNGLTCSRADLDTANPAADPVLARHAERYVRALPSADGGSLAHDVQKAIRLLLPVGQASIGRVAATLGLNERTLQRRLLAEGADYSRVLDDTRQDLAARYVANADLPLSRVASLLGYSRQSSFNRWFADAFGAAPTQWRDAGGYD